MMIRLATASDIEKIAELYVKNHVETYTGLLSDAYFASLTVDYAKEKWNPYLYEADKQLLVAYDGEEFFGFAAGMQDESLPDTWYIATLQITEKARGKGIGTAFIETMRKYAMENRYSRMSVCIVKGNEKAGNLYKKLGATHFLDFEDDFCGTISHSEKLVWNNLIMPFHLVQIF